MSIPKWFYSKDRQAPVGPVREEDLRSLLEKGQIGPGTLVWSPALTAWMPVEHVESLAFAKHPTPPPLPHLATQPADTHEPCFSSSQQPVGLQQPSESTNLHGCLTCLLIIAMLAGCLLAADGMFAFWGFAGPFLASIGFLIFIGGMCLVLRDDARSPDTMDDVDRPAGLGGQSGPRSIRPEELAQAAAAEQSTQMSNKGSPTIPYPHAPIGLGGWLTIPYIGLPFGVLNGLAGLASVLALFSDPSWPTFTTVGTEHYIPGFALLMALSALADAGLLALLIITAISFYSWKRRTTRLMISFLVLQVVVTVGESLAAVMFIPGDHSDVTKQITGSLVVAAIWIPYWLNSRRVANTFYY